MAKNSLESQRDIIISQRKKAKSIEQMAKLNKRLHEVNKKLGFTMETAPKKTYDIIKALPATYRGIKFRSRLEARWAAYFDLIGLGWVYEPEGYALDAGNYVPDFLCGEFFVEVKPTLDERQKVEPKLLELSKKTSRLVCCVVDGPSITPQWGCRDGGATNPGWIFCYYTFASKKWSFPLNSTDNGICADEPFSQLARNIRFDRTGTSEVVYKVGAA